MSWPIAPDDIGSCAMPPCPIVSWLDVPFGVPGLMALSCAIPESDDIDECPIVSLDMGAVCCWFVVCAKTGPKRDAETRTAAVRTGKRICIM